jgi:hypothetical protein
MKVTSIALTLIASASAFSPSNVSPITTTTTGTQSQLNAVTEDNNVTTNSNNNNNNMSRRGMFGMLSASTFALVTAGNSKPASAGLLDEFGSDPSKIQQAAPKEEPRQAVAKPKDASTIEPNLRSNYYYPTNKKRYLPRIKRCNDAIPQVADAIGNLDWEAVTDFNVKIADDTILPMRLYSSSLTGGGTNVKVTFTQDMNKAADDFEKAQKALTKAIKKKDQSASSRALEDMATALLAYRTTGKLLGPDGGGDIPSVDEIRRSACRVQGRTFEEKIKARDSRVGGGAAAKAKEEPAVVVAEPQ